MHNRVIAEIRPPHAGRKLIDQRLVKEPVVCRGNWLAPLATSLKVCGMAVPMTTKFRNTLRSPRRRIAATSAPAKTLYGSKLGAPRSIIRSTSPSGTPSNLAKASTRLGARLHHVFQPDGDRTPSPSVARTARTDLTRGPEKSSRTAGIARALNTRRASKTYAKISRPSPIGLPKILGCNPTHAARFPHFALKRAANGWTCS